VEEDTHNHDLQQGLRINKNTYVHNNNDDDLGGVRICLHHMLNPIPSILNRPGPSAQIPLPTKRYNLSQPIILIPSTVLHYHVTVSAFLRRLFLSPAIHPILPKNRTVPGPTAHIAHAPRHHRRRNRRAASAPRLWAHGPKPW
jgi:hypothetical protein